MKIEFQTPYEKVSEKLINSIRDEMLQLSHLNKHITRAEVLLKEDSTLVEEDDKICEISLTVVFGNDLFVHAQAKRFNRAAKEAISDLRRLVNQQVEKEKELTDDRTVKVNA